MRAVVFRKYGTPDVLELVDLEKPSPKSGEVFLKVHATTVTAGDCEFRRYESGQFIGKIVITVGP
jgi:NADPH:quinone reductase-like Zn-dependent oxidoreductase